MARMAGATATTSGFSYFIVFTSFLLHDSCCPASWTTNSTAPGNKQKGLRRNASSSWCHSCSFTISGITAIFSSGYKDLHAGLARSGRLNSAGGASLRRPRSLRCRSQHSTWIVRIKAPIGSSSAWRALSNASWNASVSIIPRWALIIWELIWNKQVQSFAMAFMGERTTNPFRLLFKISSGTIPASARRTKERR